MTPQQFSLSLPLRIVRRPQTSLVDIVEANGRLICPCDEYDAPQLVRSVNAFPGLLAACKALLKANDPRCQPIIPWMEAEAAIAEAEKEV